MVPFVVINKKNKGVDSKQNYLVGGTNKTPEN